MPAKNRPTVVPSWGPSSVSCCSSSWRSGMWKWELSEAVGEITVFDGWVGLCWGGYNQAIRGEVNVPNTCTLKL